MSQPFPHLFQPLQLRHKTLKNRIVFGAHTANMSEGGLPGDRHLGYYRERARGGAAAQSAGAQRLQLPIPRLGRARPARPAAGGRCGALD